jgi:hypothetical protein
MSTVMITLHFAAQGGPVACGGALVPFSPTHPRHGPLAMHHPEKSHPTVPFTPSPSSLHSYPTFCIHTPYLNRINGNSLHFAAQFGPAARVRPAARGGALVPGGRRGAAVGGAAGLRLLGARLRRRCGGGRTAGGGGKGLPGGCGARRRCGGGRQGARGWSTGFGLRSSYFIWSTAASTLPSTRQVVLASLHSRGR